MKYTIEGDIVDLYNREVFKGSIEVEDGYITAVNRDPTTGEGYIMPGFIDAHVHIESSMLTPENFGYISVEQGTVAVVSDPHEIANVLGVKGVEFMVENSERSPLKTYFTIPSCVPATAFDRAGCEISSAEVEQMAATGRYVGLSEMMNVPGVLSKDPEVMAKLATASKYRLPVDGHAPLLQGQDLAVYVSHRICTDHECVTIAEAQQKVELGMKVMIREGSAAQNYEALKSLIKTNPNQVMFCTDDSHPDEIMSGHIRKLVSRSVADGFDLFDVLTIASINPINHYKLDVGQLRVGDRADFIVTNDLETFTVRQVYINGLKRLGCEPEYSKVMVVNNFNHDRIDATSLRKAVSGSIKVISLVKGEILTTVEHYSPKNRTENLESDIGSDIAKIVYINRYDNGVPQVAFCKGFGLKDGAFASSISHDSHNIIAVGMSDSELVEVINTVIDNKGALAVCGGGQTEVLPLPIGGIMSDRNGRQIDVVYQKLNESIKKLGCTLESPFMTLSFLSLVVIPEIKIGEKGLFSYTDFNWIEQ